jgi:hypothetical protein
MCLLRALSDAHAYGAFQLATSIGNAGETMVPIEPDPRSQNFAQLVRYSVVSCTITCGMAGLLCA